MKLEKWFFARTKFTVSRHPKKALTVLVVCLTFYVSFVTNVCAQAQKIRIAIHLSLQGLSSAGLQWNLAFLNSTALMPKSFI